MDSELAPGRSVAEDARMNAAVPEQLKTPANADVLRYVAEKSAHSDVGQALAEAVSGLDDVQLFCPDASQYRYVVVSTKGVIFGFAVGMNTVGLRLGYADLERAKRSGADDAPGVDENWAVFTLFRGAGPEVNLKAWARKVYAFAREMKP